MSEMLTAVAIIFIAAGPFLLIANRYTIPPAPLLIVAGLVAGVFIDEAIARELAEFGIALLVFAFGVSIQFGDLHAVIEDGEFTAVGQIFVVGSLGVGFGLLLGVPLGESLFLGIAVALSSTIVATALLEREIRMNLIRARVGESIQFVQDLFAVTFILIISAEVIELDPIVLQIGYGVLFLIAAGIVNRYVFDAIGTLAGDSDELMIVGGVSLLVVFMAAATLVEIPIVVAAFAAGLAVRHDPVEYLGLLNGIASIKDFFVTIFFVTVGALVVVPFVQMEVAASIEKLILVVGVVLLTAVVKPVVTTAILIYRGYEARTSTLIGLSTDQVSEFSLIIAIQALAVGFLTQHVFDAIILAAAITMMTSTVSQNRAEWIYRRFRDRGIISGTHSKIDALSDVPHDISDHVIVVGYGDAGKRIVETLESIGVQYVVIENDPADHDIVRVDCDAYVFGDALEEYSWEKANLEAARAIVSMTSSPPVSRGILDLDFDESIVLRAETEREAVDLIEAGATYVAVPDLLAGEELVDELQRVFAGEMSVEEWRTRGMETLEFELREGPASYHTP